MFLLFYIPHNARSGGKTSKNFVARKIILSPSLKNRGAALANSINLAVLKF
jgi:hypothetical protein